MSEDYEVEVTYGGPGLSRVPLPEPAQEPVPEEFERFEDLASKLAGVPKSELDEKRQH